MKKRLNNVLQPVQKLGKGLLALFTFNLLFVLSVFIFDSCKKAAYEKSSDGQANAQFTAALQANRSTIGSIPFTGYRDRATVARAVAPPADQLTVYLQFPADPSPKTATAVQDVHSMYGLVDLIHQANATLQYAPSGGDANFQMDIPLETISNSLAPLIQESKQFLYSKGFTERDIQEMIAEENATEADLIPLVMIITREENNRAYSHRPYNLFPVNSAYAKLAWSDVGACAMEAVGADILYSLGKSSATVWSVAAIKKAFTTVAKRMLGPIGVAIAVVDFSWCLMRAE